jgi:putative transposase
MRETTPNDDVSSRRATAFPDLEDAVIAGTHRLSPAALELFLRCSRFISLALAHALSKWWRHDGTAQAGFAEQMLRDSELEKVRAIAEIQRARLGRFPARQRKHYTPQERFEILALMRDHGLGRQETARQFLIDPQTITRWEREVLTDSEAETVGTLVRPDPPLRGYDDVVKRLVLRLDDLGVGGSLKIAQMLARAGTKIGRETVRRYRRTGRVPQPTGSDQATHRALRAKYVNHIWLADLTEIRGFLGLYRFKLVAVLDLFSRFPLAYRIFCKEPTADEVLGVLDQAMRRHGRPRHFVSDQGSQFTAQVFRETLNALSIRQRFGAIGQYGSIAVIERFWRTLKGLLGVRLWPPLSAAHLEARAGRALMYYATLRPHQGLGGATPSEIYNGEHPAVATAIPPPRIGEDRRAGEELLSLDVVFLDPERRLPVLMPRRRAA